MGRKDKAFSFVSWIRGVKHESGLFLSSFLFSCCGEEVHKKDDDFGFAHVVDLRCGLVKLHSLCLEVN